MFSLSLEKTLRGRCWKKPKKPWVISTILSYPHRGISHIPIRVITMTTKMHPPSPVQHCWKKGCMVRTNCLNMTIQNDVTETPVKAIMTPRAAFPSCAVAVAPNRNVGLAIRITPRRATSDIHSIHRRWIPPEESAMPESQWLWGWSRRSPSYQRLEYSPRNRISDRRRQWSAKRTPESYSNSRFVIRRGISQKMSEGEADKNTQKLPTKHYF